MELDMEASPHPISIAVLTCERAGFYVGETIHQIAREGGASLPRRLYLDGSEEFAKALACRLRPYGGDSWELVRLGEGLGSSEAMRRLVVHAAQEGRDLLFFEDDLLLCRNAVSRMIAQHVPDDVGIVTFFDMKEIKPGSAPGLYRRPADGGGGKGFWGAQCLKFSSESLIWLAEHDWMVESRGDSRMASDILMGRVMAKHPERRKLAVHIPCLVEHVGHSSACFPGLSLSPRWRRATNFMGRHFDAMSLGNMV